MIKRLFFTFLTLLCFSPVLWADQEFSVKDQYLILLQKCLLNALPKRTNPPLHDLFTQLSQERLDHLWQCMKEVEENHVPGDFIEAGVWKGGATIFMRAFLAVNHDTERKVWVADSFAGFPPTNRANEREINNIIMPFNVVSLETVKNNFALFNLLDDQVCFLKGFFSQTLPHAPIRELAILRLDGDLYESTMDALIHLYPKLSIGGYLIIDDYGHFPGCAEAINDYRKMHGITEEIVWEDYTGVHWKKRG